MRRQIRRAHTTRVLGSLIRFSIFDFRTFRVSAFLDASRVINQPINALFSLLLLISLANHRA